MTTITDPLDGLTALQDALNQCLGAWSRRTQGASTMPKNRIVKAPTNGLTASRDKILASLACYSHTSDWQISLRLLETISSSGADSGC